jgi:hypothetical protein
MPKPMMIPFIPLVNIGGKSSLVVANLFNAPGNFSQHSGSFKRPRVEDGSGDSRDSVYELSRDVSAVSFPSAPRLDFGRIPDPMVKANEMAVAIRAQLSGGRRLRGDEGARQAQHGCVGPGKCCGGGGHHADVLASRCLQQAPRGAGHG